MSLRIVYDEHGFFYALVSKKSSVAGAWFWNVIWYVCSCGFRRTIRICNQPRISHLASRGLTPRSDLRFATRFSGFITYQLHVLTQIMAP